MPFRDREVASAAAQTDHVRRLEAEIARLNGVIAELRARLDAAPPPRRFERFGGAFGGHRFGGRTPLGDVTGYGYPTFELGGREYRPRFAMDPVGSIQPPPRPRLGATPPAWPPSGWRES